ncbi:hypothetical protein SISNIDRAFT_465863 [Sistotremastrum niveocremeum HHB9708]|uniref:RNase III domain-containing protein n=1 Tax=Sistotremastrum niveocremeum HHB9708 TaxID=1314777 RepID=A0A164UZS0_9AGAM|nr:hypothetical protein SISNIDRAFT_465863 [Sistotremastrum niveocremeum HHB9708]
MAPIRHPKQSHPGAFDLPYQTEQYRRNLSRNATQQAIYQLKTGTVLPNPSMLSDALQKIIFKCHQERKQRWGDDYLPPWFSRKFVPPPGTREISNKLLELWGDAIMHYAVPKVNERYTKNPRHHAEGSERLQQNHVYAHFAVEMDLLNNPYLDISDEDRLEIINFDPDTHDHPPKILANLFEAFVGALWLSGGLAAVFGWLVPIIKALHSCANRRDLERWSAETRYFPLKTFYDARCIDKLCAFISSNRVQIRRLGKRLRHSLPKDRAMSFNSHGNLLPPFSRGAETAEGFIRVNILSGWYLSRLEVFFITSEDIGSVVFHLTEICALIMSPQVLACLSRALRLDRHIHESCSGVSALQMAYALISAVGFFERSNNHQLFALEPLFALLADVADHVLMTTPHVHPVTNRLFASPEAQFASRCTWTLAESKSIAGYLPPRPLGSINSFNYPSHLIRRSHRRPHKSYNTSAILHPIDSAIANGSSRASDNYRALHSSPPRRPAHEFRAFRTLPDIYVPPDDADLDTDSDGSSDGDWFIREPGKPIDQRTTMRLCHPSKRIPAARSQLPAPNKVLETSTLHNQKSGGEASKSGKSASNQKHKWQDDGPASETSLLPYLSGVAMPSKKLEQRLQDAGLHRLPQYQIPDNLSSLLNTFHQRRRGDLAYDNSTETRQPSQQLHEQVRQVFEARDETREAVQLREAEARRKQQEDDLDATVN